MTTELGSEIEGVMADWGTLFGIGSGEIGGIMILVMSGLAVVVGAMMGHAGIGFGTGYVVVIAGAITGMIGWVILGLVTMLAIVIFIFTHLANK